MVVTSVLRLRRYSAVRTREGAKFLELRVAGLALERGYKAARDVGLGALDKTHVELVRLAARKVQVLQDGEWQLYRRVCHLEVAPAEAKLQELGQGEAPM